MDNVECDEVMMGNAFMVPRINYYNEHIKNFSHLDHKKLKVIFLSYDVYHML